MNIRTINHIETSSLCDRTCRYCPSKDMHKHRETGLMSMETFDAVMEWVRYLVRKGTQTEINLHGVGEPTLNSLLPEMISKARKILPTRHSLHINTNGAWVDATTTETTEREREFVLSLKSAGISNIDVTGHDAFRAARAVRVLSEAGIPGRISVDAILNPNNWAGQVDWLSPTYNAGPCPWLHRGQVMIMSNGDVAKCCIDAFGTSIAGNVLTSNIEEIELTPFGLCERCHHEV